VLARAFVALLRENQDVVRDADACPIGQRHRHHHPLVVHIGAIAAPEVDELVLPAIVAADEGVLAGNQGAEAQADGIFSGPANSRRIPDRDIKGVGLGWLNRKFRSHWVEQQFAGCTLGKVAENCNH